MEVSNLYLHVHVNSTDNYFLTNQLAPQDKSTPTFVVLKNFAHTKELRQSWLGLTPPKSDFSVLVQWGQDTFKTQN